MKRIHYFSETFEVPELNNSEAMEKSTFKIFPAVLLFVGSFPQEPF